MAKNPIDWQECLRINNQREDVALELLDMMKSELEQAKAGILQSMEIRHWQILATHVHKLHGASCYCGTTTLRLIAANVEQALQSKAPKNIDALVKDLLAEIDRVQQALSDNNYRG